MSRLFQDGLSWFDHRPVKRILPKKHQNHGFLMDLGVVSDLRLRPTVQLGTIMAEWMDKSLSDSNESLKGTITARDTNDKLSLPSAYAFSLQNCTTLPGGKLYFLANHMSLRISSYGSLFPGSFRKIDFWSNSLAITISSPFHTSSR